MKTDTLADPRPRLWAARHHETDRLTQLTTARELRGEELNHLIALSQARIREMGDAIIDATRPPDASTSNGL